jgi:PAS domain S-box-containing protein
MDGEKPDRRPAAGGGATRRLSLFDRSAALVCLTDGRGVIVEANPALHAAFGMSAGALKGRPLRRFSHPDDVDVIMRACNSVAAGAEETPVACRWRCADGRFRWIEWSLSPADAPDRLIAVGRDVTEERRARAHGAALEDAGRLGCWEVDLETRELFWSPMVYRIHDLDPDAFRPTLEDGLRFYAPEALPQIRAAVDRLIAAGEPYSLTLPIITALGRRVWVRATAEARLRDGKVERAFGTFADITVERERTEHLRRLGAVAEKTTNLVLLTDGEGQLEWANAAFWRLVDREPAAGAGRDGQLRDAVRRLLGDGAAAEEVALGGVGGDERWLQVERRRLDDAWLVVCADVSELKRQEARLRDAEREASAARESLEAAVNVLEHGFALYDATDRLVMCNAAYRQAYAVSAPAIRHGARFEDILRYGLAHGQYAEAVGREEAWLAQRLAAHAEPVRDLVQALPDDRWVRVREQRTPSGGRVGLRIDITESVRDRRRLQAILDGTGAGAWEWDAVNDVLGIDPQWSLQKGLLSPDQVERCRQSAFWVSRIHPEDLPRYRSALADHLRGRTDFYDVEMRIRRANGGWSWVHDRGRASARDARGRVLTMSGVRMDADVRKRAELALAEALSAANAATEAKSQFLANMSHEIRTPLTSVVGYARLLHEQPELSETSKGYLDRVARGCDALLATVNDVLDYSKLEAGEVSIAPRPTDPMALVREAAGMFAPRAAEKGLDLRVETAADAPSGVMLDPERLRQVLMNLIGNAVKFTERGSVTIEPSYDAATQRLSVAVRDTGPGFSAAEARRLFRRFSQVDDTNTRQHGGTGLGLAICRFLVEAMGGEIGCEGRPGVGAVFRLSIPARSVENVGAAGDDRLSGVRVLIGLADPEARERLREALEDAGAAPAAAEDGEAVRGLSASRPFDVLVVENALPRLDLAAWLDALRTAPGPNDCAAVLIAGADDAAAAAFGANVDGALVATLDGAAMVDAVARALTD